MFKLDTFARMLRHASPRSVSRVRFVEGDGGEGGEGGGAADFEATAIPADKYADNPNISKYKTVGDLVRGHSEAVKLVGAKGVILPGEKAEQAEIDRFYNSIGRPEKPDGYKLSTLENLHPEVKITPESEAGFKALVHKHGLTAKQADGLYKEYFGMISGSMTKRDESLAASRHEAEKSLRTDWGADYDKNLAGAKRMATKFGGKDMADYLNEGPGNDPRLAKFLGNISKKFSEDGFIKGEAVTNSETKEAQQRITDIMLKRDHPYWVAGPGHAEAVAEMKRLQTIVHPEVEA